MPILLQTVYLLLFLIVKKQINSATSILSSFYLN